MAKAKKAAAAKLADALVADASGMIADPKKEGIPVALQHQNRKPLTEEQAAKVAATTAEQKKVVPFNKPKGMTIEDWEARQSRERQKRETEKLERLAKLPKKKKTERPEGSFKLTGKGGLAESAGIADKDARRVARNNKDKLKVLEVFGKYVYADASREEVLKIIKDGLSAEKKKKSTTKKSTKKDEPIPPGAVWSGKGKKTKKAEPAPVVSKKTEARAEAKKVMKGRKKIKVEGGAIYVAKKK